MILSIVSDEISADLETAIELGTEWGLSQFELRGYGTERVPLYSLYHKQRVRELLEEYHVKVCAISPGLFKIPFSTKKRERFPVQAIDSSLYQRWQDGRSLIRYHQEELLPASIDYAKEIGATTIVIFSFMRGEAPPDHIPDEILEALHRAASEASAAGVQLSIEVEEGFWADSGFHTSQIIKSVDQSSLGVNWDPGNSIMSGERPYPEGYECIRSSVNHVHFKDVIYSPEHGFQYRVEGTIDWSGQIKALVADGYSGCISVEPHLWPKVSSARAAMQRLMKLIKETES
jgi:sugar phosphate isomerase/epimerase